MKRNIMDLAGALKYTDEEAEEMKDNIKNLNKKATKNLLKKIKYDLY